MAMYSESTSRNVVFRFSVALLAVMGLSRCRGLSLGRGPLRTVGGLSARSAPTMSITGSHKISYDRFRLDSGDKRTHVARKEGTRLYGYLDKLDRASGLNYNDYWGRKRNATDLVDSMQNAVESAPKPFNKLVSAELWYVARPAFHFSRLHRQCFVDSSVSFYRADLRRRGKYYKSDWTDAFQKKRQVLPAILFLYFACLSPAVSFGTIASEITGGSIGIVEFLLSSGMSGMVKNALYLL